jgi:hypothetical protein
MSNFYVTAITNDAMPKFKKVCVCYRIEANNPDENTQNLVSHPMITFFLTHVKWWFLQTHTMIVKLWLDSNRVCCLVSYFDEYKFGFPNLAFLYLSRFLFMAFRIPNTEAQRRYNRSHIWTHNVKERSIGIPKRRFPCLSIRLQYQPKNVWKFIVACAILHRWSVICTWHCSCKPCIHRQKPYRVVSEKCFCIDVCHIILGSNTAEWDKDLF